MLELAKKLADNDAKFFGGWVLAGAEVHIHGAAQSLTNHTLLAKERRSVLQVLGTAEDGSVAKELRVFLLLPKHVLGSKAKENAASVGILVALHAFTIAEIDDYVAYTGDENIIHKGEHPIVPGLCMAAWLQKELHLAALDWKISFLRPVYAGDAIAVYLEGNVLTAYVDGGKAFTVQEL